MMLNVSMGELGVCFLYSVCFGTVLGAVYDVFKIIKIILGVYNGNRKVYFSGSYGKYVKRIMKESNVRVYSYIVTMVSDILYFMLSGCLFSLFLYAFNYGIFRWFLLAGSLLGFVIYYNTLGKAVIKTAYIVADFVLLLINTALSVVCRIFRLAFCILFKMPYVKFLLPFIRKTVCTIDRKRFKRYTLKCINNISDIVRFD